MGSLPAKPLGASSKQIGINGHWDILRDETLKEDHSWDAPPSVLPQQLSKERQTAVLNRKKNQGLGDRPESPGNTEVAAGGRGGEGRLLGGGCFPQDPSSEQKRFHSDNTVDEFFYTQGLCEGRPTEKSFLV